jgi:hypothetical protein
MGRSEEDGNGCDCRGFFVKFSKLFRRSGFGGDNLEEDKHHVSGTREACIIIEDVSDMT